MVGGCSIVILVDFVLLVCVCAACAYLSVKLMYILNSTLRYFSYETLVLDSVSFNNSIDHQCCHFSQTICKNLLESLNRQMSGSDQRAFDLQVCVLLTHHASVQKGLLLSGVVQAKELWLSQQSQDQSALLVSHQSYSDN